MRDYTGLIIIVFVVITVIAAVALVLYLWWRSQVRSYKNYERGLKMIPLLIHLPPLSDDIEGGGRDARDITEEVVSQAQAMYNIISSTAKSGFKSKVLGQRHVSFEIVAHRGLIRYYVVVPIVLLDTIKQAVIAAYPTAKLEEVKDNNLFSEVGKLNGTIGGEFSLKKSYEDPIATYQESKRDAMRAVINALSMASKDDGAGVQILIRPACEGWTKRIENTIDDIRKDRKGMFRSSSGSMNWIANVGDLIEALWKPPETHGSNSGGSEIKQLSGAEQTRVEALEDKARYSGFETMIRVVTSSNTAAKSQVLLQNIISSFSLFDSPTGNGFKFTMAKDVAKFTTDYIFRIFPQERNAMILNTIELSTIFHFPDQSNIPTSKVERQATKQVDGPSRLPEEGLLLGYNVFRGVKKPIRLGTDDRRRHTYVIGATGMGKSVFLENLAFQDMKEGRGFAFVDPHGDSAEKLLSLVPPERMDDVIYFDPGDLAHPMGMNIFEVDKEDEKDFIIQECINMLYSLYDPGHTGIFGPRGEHMFRNAALLLMSDPEGGTWIDVPRVFRDPEYVRSKLSYVKDNRVIDYWTKEFPASQRSNEAGEVITWFISKWGPFESNTMFRNVIGQTRGAFSIRDIMDNKKILLVNLSKGKMGELNSKLLGMIFIMKFQTAAMSRVDTPMEQRQDFCLYVDEFQNFATDSFESILAEARKFRLNLVVANQFMTQLTEKIREAIIGNIGTVICGRIGITDAELMVKRFQPVFDVSDLQDIPNHEAIVETLIDGTPTAPFTMSLPAPMGEPSQEVYETLRQMSAVRYARPRAEVEQEIDSRYTSGISPLKPQADASLGQPPQQSSFIDEWLAKRKSTQTAHGPRDEVSSNKPSPSPSRSQSSPTEPANEVVVDLRHQDPPTT